MIPFRKPVLAFALIAAATGALYMRTLAFDFVNYDDGVYVTHNEHVLAGLTWDSVVHAFTTGETGTWQPLALMSHMLDATLFGRNAGGHHATSAVLHALNTFLLGLALWRMTGAAGPSLFIAAVFGLHPLHVESVAWVSERKDVLSTFFFMIALSTYARWAAARRTAWLALTTLALALGLLAKPMLVTLPCVLLLLDFWPLRRVNSDKTARCIARLIAEKLPMIALVLVFCVVTIAVQHSASATSALGALPLPVRIENALIAYFRYIGKTLWPSGLSIYYPHAYAAMSTAAAAVSLCGLIVVTAVAWRLRRSAPYVIVGWLWYLVTLLPVIGIIQVGTQAIADRYAYVPMIGLLIAGTWGARDLVAARAPHAGFRVLPVVSVVLVVILASLTWVRMAAWRDSETLYRTTLAAMPDNAVANMGLGQLLVDRNQFAEAVPFLETALAKKHREPEAHFHLAIANQGLQRLPQAEAHYRAAVALDPMYSQAWNNLGVTLDALGNPEEALAALMRGVDTGPRNQEAAANLVRYLVRLGRVDEARRELAAAADRMPDSAEIKALSAQLDAVFAPPPGAPAP